MPVLNATNLTCRRGGDLSRPLHFERFVAAINEQMGNEFSAMLQYYAIAAHFGAEGLRELSAHFYVQAEEEKEHALRFIQFVLDKGARVKISAVSRATGALRSRRRRGKAFARTRRASHKPDQCGRVHGKG